MTPGELLDRIDRLFAERGHDEYHGEAVSQLEHALQTAQFAEQEGQPAAIIAAALLHDIGHLLHGHGEECAAQGIDDAHEELGMRFLAKAFDDNVTEPVRFHVAAKRFLCSTDSSYFAKLSAASVLSLELQGGPMSLAECQTVQSNPHFTAAIRIREYDDRAKIVGLATPTLAHFRKYLEGVIRAEIV